MKLSGLVFCSLLCVCAMFRLDGKKEDGKKEDGKERNASGLTERAKESKMKRRETIIDLLDSSKPILYGGSYNLVSEWTGKKDPLNSDQSVVYRHSADLPNRKRKREGHLAGGKSVEISKSGKNQKKKKSNDNNNSNTSKNNKGVSKETKKQQSGKGKSVGVRAKGKTPAVKTDIDYKSPWGYSTWNGGMFRKAARCVEIPSNMTLCRGVGYDRMRVPNLLDHDGELEAVVQSSYWLPLWSSKCHRDTRIFLCSMFAPVCLEQPIYPCRGLCEAVRDSCVERMNKHGFPWPEILECDQFPDDTQLCIGLRGDEDLEIGDRCPVCSAVESMESIIDSFCNAEFVARISLDRTETADGDLKLISKAKKLYKKPATVGRRRVTSAKEWLIRDQAQCDCPLISGLRDQRSSKRSKQTVQKRNSTRDSQYLIMGSRKDGQKLVLSFVQPVRRGSSLQNKALRMLTGDDQKLCSTMSG